VYDVLEATVTEKSGGHPLPQTPVVVVPARGENLKAVTDDQGKIKVEVPPGEHKIEIDKTPPPPPPPPSGAGGKESEHHEGDKTRSNNQGAETVPAVAADPAGDAVFKDPDEAAPKLSPPHFNAVARFKFHEKVLTDPAVKTLLWGTRSSGGGRGQNHWQTNGAMHVDSCDRRCSSDHSVGYAYCTYDKVHADPGPCIDNPMIVHLTGKSQEQFAEEFKTQGKGTFCNLGTMLCYGEAYGGPNIWKPKGSELNANEMVRYWNKPSSGHFKVLLSKDFKVEKDKDSKREDREYYDAWLIAECGGYVWAGADKGDGVIGHVWAWTSRAENSLKVANLPAAQFNFGRLGKDIPCFHVGGGPPKRAVHGYDGGGWLDKLSIYVPLETWDLFQKFKDQVGLDGVDREIQRVRAEVKAAGGDKGDK
jgi:hypothetical protein